MKWTKPTENRPNRINLFTLTEVPAHCINMQCYVLRCKCLMVGLDDIRGLLQSE